MVDSFAVVFVVQDVIVGARAVVAGLEVGAALGAKAGWIALVVVLTNFGVCAVKNLTRRASTQSAGRSLHATV